MNYFERPEISNSGLRYLKSSYADYLEYKRNPKPPTSAMQLGTVTHSLILEDKEEFVLNNDICEEIGGKKPTATKRYKEWLEEQQLPILSQNDYELLIQMNRSVRKHPLYSEIAKLPKEVELYGEINGVKCRGKCDAIDVEKGIIYDLKTIAELNDVEMEKKSKWDHITQASFYVALAEQIYGKRFYFVFLFVEKKAPFKCIAYKQGGVRIYEGHDIICGILDKMKQEKLIKVGYHQFCNFEGEEETRGFEIT